MTTTMTARPYNDKDLPGVREDLADDRGSAYTRTSIGRRLLATLDERTAERDALAKAVDEANRKMGASLKMSPPATETGEGRIGALGVFASSFVDLVEAGAMMVADIESMAPQIEALEVANAGHAAHIVSLSDARDREEAARKEAEGRLADLEEFRRDCAENYDHECNREGDPCRAHLAIPGLPQERAPAADEVQRVLAYLVEHEGAGHVEVGVAASLAPYVTAPPPPDEHPERAPTAEVNVTSSGCVCECGHDYGSCDSCLSAPPTPEGDPDRDPAQWQPGDTVVKPAVDEEGIVLVERLDCAGLMGTPGWRYTLRGGTRDTDVSDRRLRSAGYRRISRATPIPEVDPNG